MSDEGSPAIKTEITTPTVSPSSEDEKAKLILQELESRGQAAPGEILNCQLCPKVFSYRNGLIRHLKSLHLKEKPFKCDVCGRSFGYKNILVEHQNLHYGIKPYSCTECGKRFAARSNLVQHRVSHKNSFNCHLCYKVFEKPGEFKRHLMDSHPKGTLECGSCGFAAKSQRQLSQHIMSNHVAKSGTIERPRSSSESDTSANKRSPDNLRNVVTPDVASCPLPSIHTFQSLQTPQVNQMQQNIPAAQSPFPQHNSAPQSPFDQHFSAPQSPFQQHLPTPHHLAAPQSPFQQNLATPQRPFQQHTPTQSHHHFSAPQSPFQQHPSAPPSPFHHLSAPQSPFPNHHPASKSPYQQNFMEPRSPFRQHFQAPIQQHLSVPKGPFNPHDIGHGSPFYDENQVQPPRQSPFFPSNSQDVFQRSLPSFKAEPHYASCGQSRDNFNDVFEIEPDLKFIKPEQLSPNPQCFPQPSIGPFSLTSTVKTELSSSSPDLPFLSPPTTYGSPPSLKRSVLQSPDGTASSKQPRLSDTLVESTTSVTSPTPSADSSTNVADLMNSLQSWMNRWNESNVPGAPQIAITITPRSAHTSPNNTPLQNVRSPPNVEQVIQQEIELGRLFECIHCGILFRERGLYFLHASLHDTTTPFRCSICHTTCNDKNDFHLHFVNQPHHD